MLSQADYKAIRMYVENGHALHPDYARSLLESFEQCFAALDRALTHGVDQAACDILMDVDGELRIVLE